MDSIPNIRECVLEFTAPRASYAAGRDCPVCGTAPGLRCLRRAHERHGRRVAGYPPPEPYESYEQRMDRLDQRRDSERWGA